MSPYIENYYKNKELQSKFVKVFFKANVPSKLNVIKH